MLSLPNVLTYLRILAVPALAACFLLVKPPDGRWLAMGIFGLACITDWLDGYIARAWGLQSTLGRILDPIADKLLVGTALMLLVHDNTIDGVHIIAALVILCREILVSGLREFLAELNVRIHVTTLAKYKTSLQMLALGVLLLGPAGDRITAGVTATGIVLLWLAALLTLWTGYDYLRAAIRSAIER
ncbi:MAG TPA: CDP-diacylglycerol--glycerol-3-phosphate 3-phosphatidyltransferase [Hyphomicrobiaceae bacterium]|nr:CDP-diacylglycerol--glycerol-3-phosphate 3-phosphatidyltransferase [Hyphomicrobiaceae bacterium]